MAHILPRSRLLFASLLITSTLVCPSYAAEPAQAPSSTAQTSAPAKPPLGGKLEAELVYKATVGTPQEIKELLQKGAQADKAYNSESAPALGLAAQRTDPYAIGVMGAMIDGGANINIRDGYGQSPLFYAARVGATENVRYLLSKGAVYYQTDKNGNIARNIAHAQGHDEVMKVMDEFVSSQTKQVMNAYAERDKKIQEQMNDLAALRTENKPEKNSGEDRDIPVRKNTESPGDRYEFKKLIYDLSYHSCASAYWEFCRGKRLQTELGEEAVKARIEAHELLKDETARTLTTQYDADSKYLQRIIGPSERKLVEQFKVYATNAHLKGAGVGTKRDVEDRCSALADSWDVKPRKRKAEADKTSPQAGAGTN